jgi:hypothetical protein
METSNSLGRTQTGIMSGDLHSVILHVSDGPRPSGLKVIKLQLRMVEPIFKERIALEIETVIQMEKESRWLLFSYDLGHSV